LSQLYVTPFTHYTLKKCDIPVAQREGHRGLPFLFPLLTVCPLISRMRSVICIFGWSKTSTMASSSNDILALDIGGSHIKGTILNTKGEWQIEYKSMDTPNPATPESVIKAITELVKGMPDYGKISVGFPGYVRNGIIYTAPNLGNPHWKSIDLGQQISNLLQKPVRLVNDADQLGLGVVSGKGYELAVTLGTGVGTAILMDGYLLPHMELAHHPIRKDVDYDQYIGAAALESKGKEKWSERVGKVLEILKTIFNYDRLYLGGGNAGKLTIKLDENIQLFTNKDAIKGGARLWDFEDKYFITTNHPAAGGSQS
jgi:polyphosphate glucokinase